MGHGRVLHSFTFILLWSLLSFMNDSVTPQNGDNLQVLYCNMFIHCGNLNVLLGTILCLRNYPRMKCAKTYQRLNKWLRFSLANSDGFWQTG